MLMEPKAAYGKRTKIQLTLPEKDLPLARDLARRFGWNVK